MMPKPPATAAPFTAAMTGFGYTRSTKTEGPGPSSAVMRSPDAKALRSIPAQKARSPAPVSTTTRTASSCSALVNASPMPR